jgi:hypothetical protein
MLAHRFNIRGYRAYWQERGVNFTISLSVLCYVRGEKQETDKKVVFPYA